MVHARGAMNGVAWCLSVAVLVGCVGAPSVRHVYEDRMTSVRLQEDRKAGSGHRHPATFSPEQVARILGGVRVNEQRYMVHELLAGEAPVLLAFDAAEIRALAPALSKAFAMAKAGELVTFYRRYSSESVGLAYTSGGLFVHEDHLYIVLSNYRQIPSDIMRKEIPSYEIDPVDDPLLSLRRGGYSVTFQPEEAVVHPTAGQWTWFYPDPGKVVIVDAILATKPDRATSEETGQPPGK